MPIEVLMPKLSPTMENGQLVEWKVKVGDSVREGDILADVETDKASMPMKAFDDGTVAFLAIQPGDEVALNQLVMVLARKGEDPKEVAAKYAGGGAVKETKAAAAAKPEPAAARPVRHESEAESFGDIADEDNVGGETTNTPNHPEESSGNGQGDFHYEHPPATGRIKASPLARKVAASAGVDIARIKPSGPGGRVIRRDVEEFVKTAPKARPAAAAASAAAPAPAAGKVEKVALTRMRSTIAKRMSEAKRVAPDIHLTVDIRVDTLVGIREKLNQKLAAEKIKLSVGDFVTKAVATALRKHPDVNATFEDDAIYRHGDVNVGLAVALDGGLIVPVLRNADRLGLREIRLESEALYTAARQSKLTGDQLQGGTFTISNLGMFGIREFDAILNLPQVGILAVGAAEKRPIVVDDALTIGTMMTVTLTADHRALDGASAAVFLQTLKGLLEEPASMLL